MAFNIKNDEADALLRELTALTGESLTDAVIVSLRERLARQRRLSRGGDGDPLREAISHLRAIPVVDHRTAEEILGYDEQGLPS